jgi:hypothetical protein
MYQDVFSLVFAFTAHSGLSARCMQHSISYLYCVDSSACIVLIESGWIWGMRRGREIGELNVFVPCQSRCSDVQCGCV